MRHLRTSIALLCVFLLQAGSAFAKLDDGGIEHLSGPGPFVRIGFEYRAVCFAKGGGQTRGTVLHPWDRGATFEFAHLAHPPAPAGDARAEAHKKCADDTDVLGFITVAYGHYFSLENNLFPANLTGDPFTVKAESASVRFMGRTMQGVIDVGVGADVFWFHGDAFESFTRFAVEPVRLSIAPAAALTASPRARAVHLTVAPTILLGRLDQSDFCNTSACTATPRPFSSRTETLWAATIQVDVVTLLSGK